MTARWQGEIVFSVMALLKMEATITASASVSASSLLVGFGELNDNTIKGLTGLLSVE